jgi:hypothetical protein
MPAMDITIHMRIDHDGGPFLAKGPSMQIHVIDSSQGGNLP